MQEFNNDIYNQQILWKYLTESLINKKSYPKDKAKELALNIIKNTPNIWGKKGLAYKLGKESFDFFCLYFLQDVFVPKDNNTARNLSQVHYDIWNELGKLVIEDKYNMEEFILPRGVAKTTVINKALTTYANCYRISRYSLVIGKTKDDAATFIEDIKKFISFEPIVKSFGNLLNRRGRTINSQELEFDNDTMVRAYGWETSVRGTSYSAFDGIFRPMLVICDDILNENDIKTDNAKENAVNKFYKEILEVGDSAVIRNGKKIKMASKFIILGTPLAKDCFINTIRKDPQFKVFKRSVVDFNIDEYFENNEYWQKFKKILFNTKTKKEDKEILLKQFYNDNYDEVQFPTIWEKYDCYDLAIKYFTKRTAFLQELMCDCENVGEKWFKSMKKVSADELDSLQWEKTMLCCDPASTVNKKSDYTALCVGSLATNGFKYVREGIVEKYTFDDYCNKVINLLKTYKDITHIYIERNTYNGADLVKIKEIISNDCELSARKFEFINQHQTKNKDDKISTIIDGVNSGAIVFNKENEEFNNQVLEFSGQKTSLHDDALDVVSEFVKRIDEIEVLQPIKVYDLSYIGL